MSTRMHARGRAPRREKRECLREWYSERDGESGAVIRVGRRGHFVSGSESVVAFLTVHMHITPRPRRPPLSHAHHSHTRPHRPLCSQMSQLFSREAS